MPKSLNLKQQAGPFLDFLDNWYSELPVVSLKSALKEYSADQTALVIVDVVNGFCKEGNLSSPRVAGIVPSVVSLVRNAENLGIHHYLLTQDNHPAGSLEFFIYPEHCVEGSWESKTVEELQELPNAYKFKVLPKQSLNPGIEPAMQEWLDQNPGVRQFIVVGDCTDICVYLIAMHLKIRSVAKNVLCNVIVPADCVDTFDLAQEAESRKATPPHPGDLMHCFFLYHMHLNGIQVVAGFK